MPTLVHDFDWPDRLVVGTVGRPGERTFYLQARTGDRVVSAAMEKEQSAVLAEKIDEVLDELMVQDGNRFSVPAEAPEGLDDTDPLDQPVLEQFRVGVITLGFDPSTAQVVIEAYPWVEGSPGPRNRPTTPGRRKNSEMSRNQGYASSRKAVPVAPIVPSTMTMMPRAVRPMHIA